MRINIFSLTTCTSQNLLLNPSRLCFLHNTNNTRSYLSDLIRDLDVLREKQLLKIFQTCRSDEEWGFDKIGEFWKVPPWIHHDRSGFGRCDLIGWKGGMRYWMSSARVKVSLRLVEKKKGGRPWDRKILQPLVGECYTFYVQVLDVIKEENVVRGIHSPPQFFC